MEGNDSAETADMTTVSRRRFGDDSDEPAFSISIIENVKEEYGLFVWPCSLVLAECVPLGAGTSLPGLVAAKVGADVTLSDDSSRLEVLRRVIDLNKLEGNVIAINGVMGLTWGALDASTFSLNPKFILGADVSYDASAGIVLLNS